MPIAVVPIVPRGEGNTEPPPKKQTNEKKEYCFTLNNWTNSEYDGFKKWANSATEMWIVGKEVGEEGTPHLQGYLKLLVKARFTALKKILGDRYNWRECKGTPQQNFTYCSKDGDYEQMGMDGYMPEIVPDLITELRPFQKEILEYAITGKGTGKLLWIYDEAGQLGKTELVKYLHYHHKVPFSYGGKCSDIINLVFNNQQYFKKTRWPCMIYNLPRDTNNLRVSYNSMEQVSDGAISNVKFEAGCFICNKVKVIVFANCLPLKEKLTDRDGASRWSVKTINEEFKLMDYVAPNEELDDNGDL